MNIVVVNASTTLTDEEVQATLAALQAQANKDLAPAWGLEPTELSFVPVGQAAGTARAMSVLDDSDQAEALGYHDTTASGLPLAKVFARSCAQAGEDFRSCMSHELCEMLVDPEINSMAAVQYEGKSVVTIKEVCDPVEGDTYVIAGVPMSNFVLPAFYGASAGPYDFLGRLTAPMTMTPGGYMSFQDASGSWSQVFGEHVTTWRAKPPVGSRRERLRAGRHRWRKSTAI